MCGFKSSILIRFTFFSVTVDTPKAQKVRSWIRPVVMSISGQVILAESLRDSQFSLPVSWGSRLESWLELRIEECWMLDASSELLFADLSVCQWDRLK